MNNKMYKKISMCIGVSMVFLLLSAIGCNREEVTGDMPEDGLMPTVSADAEQESSIISENITEEDEVQQTEAEESESITLEGYDSVEPQDGGYKMFYGTWEITEVVREHTRHGGSEGYENIIGRQITYLPTAYECNGICVDNPNYLVSILPEVGSYIDYLLSMSLLLPDKGCYVWVQIVDKPVEPINEYNEDLYGSEAYIGNEFLIKDENTMYCCDYECVYELTRVSYPENESVLEQNVQETEIAGWSYHQNDAYKFFYGTWEFASLIYEDESVKGEDNESILGEQVMYSPTEYECGETRIDNPNYAMTILPIDDEFVNILLPDRDFAVWVELANASEFYSGENLLLKDDNTMYCFTNDCVYELVRISHMEGYEDGYCLKYHERW